MVYQICQGSIDCIPIQLVDAAGNPLVGVTVPPATVQVSKNGAAFATGIGVFSGIGSGYYTYCPTALETGIIGPLAVKVAPGGEDPEQITIAQVIDCTAAECDLTEVLEAIDNIDCGGGTCTIYGVTAKGLVSSKDQIIIWFTRNGMAILSGLGDCETTIYDNLGHVKLGTYVLKQTDIGAYRLLFDKRIKRGTYSLKLKVTIDEESRDFVQLFSLDPATSLEVW